MHDFDTGNDDASAAKGFESQHGSYEPFNGPMVLFDDVVEILRLNPVKIGGSARQSVGKERFFYLLNSIGEVQALCVHHQAPRAEYDQA